MSSRAELIVKRQREISFRSKNSASWNQAFKDIKLSDIVESGALVDNMFMYVMFACNVTL